MIELKEGDIVQITDPTHHWYPAIIIVSEPKAWGIQGYTIIPTNDDQSNGQAYIRLTHGAYEYVGKAVVISSDEEEVK